MQRRFGQAERTLHASGQLVAASERGVDAWGTVEQSRLEFAEQEVARLSCTRPATEAALPPPGSLEATHRLAAAPGLDVAPTSTCNYLGERGLQGAAGRRARRRARLDQVGQNAAQPLLRGRRVHRGRR